MDNDLVYVEGRVSKLLFDRTGDCTGVGVDGNRTIKASKTLLATGGITPKILADSVPKRPELQVKGCKLGAAVLTGADPDARASGQVQEHAHLHTSCWSHI